MSPITRAIVLLCVPVAIAGGCAQSQPASKPDAAAIADTPEARATVSDWSVEHRPAPLLPSPATRREARREGFRETDNEQIRMSRPLDSGLHFDVTLEPKREYLMQRDESALESIEFGLKLKLSN